MLKGKKFEIKRNHHYVMADYLRRWSADEMAFWYTTPSGKVSSDSVRGLAKQEYFYQAKPLTEKHIRDFLLLFRSSPLDLREQHLRQLEIYLKIQRLDELHVVAGQEQKDHAVRVLMCNTLEDTHAIHEREAREVMRMLSEGDLSALERDNNLIKFLTYFGHQITRTLAFKERALFAFETTKNKYGDADGVAGRLRESWWFLSYILGMNIGWGLYTNRKIDIVC